MIQEILTYLVVAWAFFMMFRFFWKTICPGKNSSSCGSGGCGSCDAKTDLFKEIKNGKYPSLVKE